MAAQVKARSANHPKGDTFWVDLPEGSRGRHAALTEHMAKVRDRLASTGNVSPQASVRPKSLSGEDVGRLLPDNVELVRVEGRHRIILRVQEGLPTPEKGHMLLELEKLLRRGIDPQAEVFLEPKGDVNALRRKLRGVTAGWGGKGG